MSLDVMFDGVSINEDNVIGAKLNTTVFGEAFALGETICRSATMEILKDGIVSIPSSVSFTHPDQSTVTMLVDNVDDTDDTFYQLHLVDYMVLLNKVIDLSTQTTAGAALEAICTELNMTHNLSNADSLYSYAFAWDGFTTARDVIGMMAEAYGGYAICEGTQISFYGFSKDPVDSIDVEDCGDFALGGRHYISRIVWDNGVNKYEYGSDTGDTLYLSETNVFFGDDSNTYDRIAAFGDNIIGMEFYNVKVEDAPIVGARAGQLISIGGYNTFVNEAWEYFGDWLGGYDCQLQTSEQAETSVIVDPLEKAVVSINSTVNRQEGLLDILGTRTTRLETDMIHFQVDAAAQEVRVTSQDTLPPTSYTAFQEDGMRIYVEGEQVAEATATRFECDKGLGVQDWAIEQTSSGTVLCFFRKW